MTLHCLFRFFFVFFVCCGSFASDIKMFRLPEMGVSIVNPFFSGGDYGLDDYNIRQLLMLGIRFLNKDQDVSVEYSQHAAVTTGNEEAFLGNFKRDPNKGDAEKKYQSQIESIKKFIGYDSVVKVVNYREGKKLYRAWSGGREGSFLGEDFSNCQVLSVLLPPEKDFNLKGSFSYKEWLKSWVQKGGLVYHSNTTEKCRVVNFVANSAINYFLGSIGFDVNWNINDASGVCRNRNLGELLTSGRRECVPKRKDAVLMALCQDGLGQGVIKIYILKGLITVGAQCK